MNKFLSFLLCSLTSFVFAQNPDPSVYIRYGDAKSNTMIVTNAAAFAPSSTTNDVLLKTIYSDIPTFSDWMFSFSPPTTNYDLCLEYESIGEEWLLSESGSPIKHVPGAPDATVLVFSLNDPGMYSGTVIANRTRTDVVGYQLGSQSNKLLQASGNYLKTESLFREVPLSDTDKNRGVTFIDSDGDVDQNVAITIGKDAKAGLGDSVPGSVPDNTTLRSTGIAIGAYAKATGTTSNGYRNQGIAIGFNADAHGMSSIAIGSGAVHSNETSLTGSSAYSANEGDISIGYKSKATGDRSIAVGFNPVASDYRAIAVGYMSQATATSSVAIGPDAKATAHCAVQIGSGTNNEEYTLKFRGHTIVKRDGTVVGTSLVPVYSGSSLVGYYLEGQNPHKLQPMGTYVTPTYTGNVNIKGQLVNGSGNTANGYGSHAEGASTVTQQSAGYSHAEGYNTQTVGGYSHADGTYALAADMLSYVWQGWTNSEEIASYSSHGRGTYNINPVPKPGSNDPATGFYIGETTLAERFNDATNSVGGIDVAINGFGQTTEIHANKLSNGPTISFTEDPNEPGSVTLDINDNEVLTLLIPMAQYMGVVSSVDQQDVPIPNVVIKNNSDGSYSIVKTWEDPPVERHMLDRKALQGKTFDFSTMAGLYIAVSNIVSAMGGTIQNFPSLQ